MAVATKIRQARTAADLTQAELGILIDVSMMTVSRWERGTSEPSITNVAALCSVLGLSADTLLGVSA